MTLSRSIYCVLSRAACLLQCSVVSACILPATATSAEWIYWADNNAHTVNRLNIQSGVSDLLVHTESANLGIAVDSFLGKMYWTDNGAFQDPLARGRIYRSNLDGTGQEVLYTASLPRGDESVGQIALDLSSNQIYWGDEEGDRIHRMNLNGTGAEIILGDVSSLGTGLELDLVNNHLYFTTGSFVGGTSKIERIDLDGTNRNDIANLYGYSIALDIHNENIYAADWNGSRIRRVAYDGTGTTDVVPFVDHPRDVQVLNGKLYYPNIRSEMTGGNTDYFFQWVRSELDGTSTTVLYEVPRLDGPLDMIQFVVVVPEPASGVLVVIGAIGLCRTRSSRRCYCWAAEKRDRGWFNGHQ